MLSASQPLPSSNMGGQLCSTQPLATRCLLGGQCCAVMSSSVQNILRALQTADALDPETIPSEIANYDFMPYLLSALPIAGSIMGVQLLHELGHRLAANARNVRPASDQAGHLHLHARHTAGAEACSAAVHTLGCVPLCHHLLRRDGCRGVHKA